MVAGAAVASNAWQNDVHGYAATNILCLWATFQSWVKCCIVAWTPKIM